MSSCQIKMPSLPPGGVVVEGSVDAAAAVVLLQPVPHPPELGVAVAVLGGEAAPQVVPEAGRDAGVASEPGWFMSLGSVAATIWIYQFGFIN